MITFKQYLKNQETDNLIELEENLFSGILNFIRSAFIKVVGAFKSAFRFLTSKLGFGQTLSMKINASLTEATETGTDSKSRLGYYSEYVTGVELARIIEDNNFKLSSSSSSALLNRARQNFLNTKLKTLSNFKTLSSEVTRMEAAGKAMANQIFSDMLIETADLKVTQFDIQLTGDSLKGEGKADIVLKARKNSKGEILAEIAGSLKAYQQSRINLANNTLTSFFTVLTGDGNFTSKALEKAQSIIFDSMVKAAMQDGMSKGEAANFLAKKNLNASEKKKFQKYKDYGRQTSKETQINTAKIMVNEFNLIYRKDRQKINTNLIKLIGMDGEDDFYAAIGAGKNMRVISSKQSADMKQFISDIRNRALTITMVPNPGKSGRASVTVTLSIGKEILSKSELSLTDTGIGSSGMTPSKGAIKTNFWFNFNDII
jgi:hypothetical protein